VEEGEEEQTRGYDLALVIEEFLGKDSGKEEEIWIRSGRECKLAASSREST